MRILFACHRLPFPPKRGGKIRPFNIIRHFSELGHSVSVASLARSDQELAEGRGLSEHCAALYVGSISRAAAAARMVGRLPTPSASTMGYFYSAALHRQVAAALAEQHFDLVFAHCSSAAQYLRAAKGIPSIMDFGDMDSRKWLDYATFKPFPMSLGYRLEAAKLYRAECALARRFDLCTCTTQAEYDTLAGYNVARQIDWFPNGVDSEFFGPVDEPYDGDRICFIGRMDYYPNQQAMLGFCADVMPILRRRRPGTRLVIVGAEPSRDIRRLGEQADVTVTGTVPDVREFVRQSAITVAPLSIARGTQNKILESMAMGVPVIASSLAARGVDAQPGVHLLTGDTPDEIASAAISVLDDPARRAELAASARRRVLSNHSWQASMRKLDGIVARVTAGVT